MIRFPLLLLFILAVQSVSLAQYASPCNEIPELNAAILKSLKPFIGKKLDRGECWDVAFYSLNKVGAKWDGLYDFGRKIDTKNECIQPGDIVQFENVKVEAKFEGKPKYTEFFAHHTAVVFAVTSAGVIELLHQNTGQFGKKMGVSPLKLSEITKGEITFFRPITD